MYAKRCSDGNWISKSVIQMDQEKIRSVMDWEVLKKERAGSSGATWLGQPAPCSNTKSNSASNSSHRACLEVNFFLVRKESGSQPHCPSSQQTLTPEICDELLLGIPHKAWWVVVLVLLCLGLAFIIPSFLPSYLLQESQSPRIKQDFSKVS